VSALDLSPEAATRLLTLVEHALAQSPEQPLGWLTGYAFAHARRGSVPPLDPRREPDVASTAPPPGPAHAAALARVPLTKRPL
jgi:hypothetical protein